MTIIFRINESIYFDVPVFVSEYLSSIYRYIHDTAVS